MTLKQAEELINRTVRIKGTKTEGTLVRVEKEGKILYGVVETWNPYRQGKYPLSELAAK